MRGDKQIKNSSYYNVEYRDGIKSRGDNALYTYYCDIRLPAQENQRHKPYIVAPNDHETAQSPFLGVEMRREKSLGNLYKHVSAMLNINLALRGGGDWACDIWHMT